MKKICVLLVGNIGSGKSTLSKGLVDAGYVAPTVEEGFDAVVKLTEDSEPSDAIKIVENVLKGLQEHGS